MKIDRFIVGEYETNCYILRRSETSEHCLIVDTGLDAEPLVNFLKENRLIPTAIILTHGHIDHIAGVVELRKHYTDTKLYIHQLDADMLTNSRKNLSLFSGNNFNTEPADCILNEGDIIDSAEIKLKVLHTPGHSPGGICLYCESEDIVFAGDTIFANSVGRTDFPGSSFSDLKKSIKNKLFTLPDETIVYTGHGPKTSIGYEKQHNPFVHC